MISWLDDTAEATAVDEADAGAPTEEPVPDEVPTEAGEGEGRRPSTDEPQQKGSPTDAAESEAPPQEKPTSPPTPTENQGIDHY